MSTPSKVSKSSLVNSLAKRYDPKALQNQGPVTAKKPPQPQPVFNYSKTPVNLNNAMDTNFDFLNQKMDNVLMTQNHVVEKLDNIMHDIGGIERDIEFIKSDNSQTEHVSEDSKDKVKMSDFKELFVEMITNLSSINKYAEQQAQKLHGVEQILLGTQNVIHFIVEEVKMKKKFNFAQKKETPFKPVLVGNKIRNQETEIQKKRGEMKGRERTQDSTKKNKIQQKDSTKKQKIKVNKDQIHEKKNWGLKGTKSLKKKKPPDSDQTGQRKKSYTYDEKVQKLNQENLEKATVILVNSSPPESCPEEESCISIAIQSRIPTPQRTPIIISEEKEHISASPDEYSNSELQAKDLCNRCVECTGHYSPGAQDLEGKTKPVALFDETEKSIDGKNEYEDAEYDEEIEDEIVEKEDKSALDAEEETKSLKGYGKTTYNTDAIHDISQYPRAQEVERAESVSSESSTNDTLALPEVDLSETEPSSNSESQVTDETVLKDDTKKSWVDTEGTELKTDKTEDVEEITINLIIPDKEPEADCEINDKKDKSVEEEDAEFSFDVSPPPPAPFTHRIVSAKHAQINSFYTVETSEMLGGGRFGQVHRCAEKSSGLSLAAKIIKVKSHKEKEEVKNEIQVMNQLNHVNLIQLYDAFESRNDIVLIMEYVEGGELFDRIIDENYNLSEADTIQFIKQIIEGIQYMHQMYIVHLDLKPENIMCVSRTAYQVKIIDFGLARRYKPREKLKVHFGTPEFLAPEVVNYDYVSFPTDMWSVGVIAYMLLSGLSPFLGEDYNETLNNILACQYDFEGEEFENISEPAKDFITKLLIKEKCWRMSATEALKHLWLSDSKLHYRISQQCLENICPVSDASGNK